MARLYIIILIMAILGGVGYGAYLYYHDTQKKITVLTKNNAKLESAVKRSEEAKTKLLNDIKKMQTQLKKVNDEFTAIRKQNGILAKKLIEDHDIGFLGANRPKSVQRIITGASKRAGRCFEILSGAPLTQKEMEAKNGKAFNRECPWLWPGNTATE